MFDWIKNYFSEVVAFIVYLPLILLGKVAKVVLKSAFFFGTWFVADAVLSMVLRPILAHPLSLFLALAALFPFMDFGGVTQESVDGEGLERERTGG